MSIPLCKDCVYHVFSGGIDVYTHSHNCMLDIEPVLGRPTLCASVRSDPFACGPNGKWFKPRQVFEYVPKKSWFQKLKEVFV